MAISWQIPRNCLAWLLVAQVALLLPHVEHLPWWVMLVYGCCAVWRIMIYQGRWSLPPKFIKVLMAFLCLIGIYQSFGSFVGLEPTIALLFAGFSLKLLEVSAKRDVYFLIFLAYFVASTGFLFSQEILPSLYLFGCLIVITASLVALHQHGFTQFSLQSLRKTLLIFAQAVPLMVVLFLVFPRFDPLWSVPVPSHQGKTGMSDTMSPGDITELGQSDELAFRAEFDGKRPQRVDMYWRGLVLPVFDGRTWEQSRRHVRLLSELERRQLRQQLTEPYRYRIIQEPSYQRWVFALPQAYTSESDLQLVSDGRLFRLKPISQRIQFNVLSDPMVKLDTELSADAHQFYLQLPENVNPQTRRYAQELRLSASNAKDIVSQVLNLFSRQAFYYTLKPPPLGEHSVDDFLFTTRRGFCEHYASSFTFLMRAAGVPARVVVGYQGGETNPITGTISVRQYDAHAWAEVWYEGEGWQRVDPTAAVSPARIEFGLEEALRQNQEAFLEDSPLSPLRYRDVAWIERLRLQMESMNYYWTKWVLDYQGETQEGVLKSLLGDITPARVAALMFFVGGGLLLLIGWQLIKVNRTTLPQQEKLYLSLCGTLAKAGYERQPKEGPIDFVRRVGEQKPAWHDSLQAVTRLFVSLNYAPLSASQKKLLLKQLRLEVFKLRYRVRVA